MRSSADNWMLLWWVRAALLIFVVAGANAYQSNLNAFALNQHHRTSNALQTACAQHVSKRPLQPTNVKCRIISSTSTSTSTALPASPSSVPLDVVLSSSSIISSTNNWGNIATLSLTASLAQLLGKTTLIGKLLGAPVTAMALTFCLSSVNWIPTLSSATVSSAASSSTSTIKWNTLLPPGGSLASTFLQGISLTLATPLLLLGTSLRGRALQQCGALLGSFCFASLGTLAGAMLAFSPLFSIQQSLVTSLPNSDGVKIAAALLAKNIGGGINYMAVCSCLGASAESVAAGLCVDNVMALVYFPLVSLLASKYDDVMDDDNSIDERGGVVEDESDHAIEDNTNESKDSSSPIEALSHAFTLAAVLTALGQYMNSKLHHLPACSSQINLSLPITTLLAVLFSTYYPPNIFLSPTSSSSLSHNNTNDAKSNNIAKAGETLGTALLYLFFATAGAPGWRLKDSIQQSFPSIASFLVILYSVHGSVLYAIKKLVDAWCCTTDGDKNHKNTFWRNVVAPQRLLVGSSAAIGGPATAAALAKSFEWKSLLTPSLLVGNVGYAIATFIGLLFYGAFR